MIQNFYLLAHGEICVQALINANGTVQSTNGPIRRQEPNGTYLPAQSGDQAKEVKAYL